MSFDPFYVFLVLLAARAAYAYLFGNQAEWDRCSVLCREVTLLDGTRASSSLMRRKVNGRWQYRRMTKQEVAESMAHSAAP